MRQFGASPGWVFGSLWSHRSLIWQMTRREVVGRYRGSLMGLVWSLFYPIVMLAVYTFVFSVVFQARWGQSESRADYAIMVFAGMVVHGLFSECLTRAPNLVLNNVNYVKRVVFPLEILPWVVLGAALFHAGVSTGVLLAFQLFVNHQIHWTLVLFPVVLAPLALLAMGASWFLASLGVYLRDVGHVMGIATTVLLFVSPVFFPVTALPEEFRLLFQFNPLTPTIEQARATLLLGQLPDWRILAIGLALGLATAWLGLVWFQRTRRGFADVL